MKEGGRDLQNIPGISNQKKEQGKNRVEKLHKKRKTKQHLLTFLALKNMSD